jgi:hypothetical protein
MEAVPQIPLRPWQQASTDGPARLRAPRLSAFKTAASRGATRLESAHAGPAHAPPPPHRHHRPAPALPRPPQPHPNPRPTHLLGTISLCRVPGGASLTTAARNCTRWLTLLSCSARCRKERNSGTGSQAITLRRRQAARVGLRSAAPRRRPAGTLAGGGGRGEAVGGGWRRAPAAHHRSKAGVPAKVGADVQEDAPGPVRADAALRPRQQLVHLRARAHRQARADGRRRRAHCLQAAPPGGRRLHGPPGSSPPGSGQPPGCARSPASTHQLRLPQLHPAVALQLQADVHVVLRVGVGEEQLRLRRGQLGPHVPHAVRPQQRLHRRRLGPAAGGSA